METLRAINSMAAAEASNMDGSRTPGAVALRKRDEKIHVPAANAISLLQANDLNPSEDRATQIRLASAIDRQITAGATGQLEQSDVTRRIMFDVLAQEAAARRMISLGDKDPLGHLASPESKREDLQPLALMQRNGVNPGRAFQSATREDLGHIATGQYDRIKSEHTKFAVSTILQLDNKDMETKTKDIPSARTATSRPSSLPNPRFPAALARGPSSAAAMSFGRKVSAER